MSKAIPLVPRTGAREELKKTTIQPIAIYKAVDNHLGAWNQINLKLTPAIAIAEMIVNKTQPVMPLKLIKHKGV